MIVSLPYTSVSLAQKMNKFCPLTSHKVFEGIRKENLAKDF